KEVAGIRLHVPLCPTTSFVNSQSARTLAFSALCRSADVSSGRFEVPEIRWKNSLSRMTSATLPV
ncbi:MAG: hypothetical protein ABW346_07205, partial [Terrimicrobium sp.]